MADLKEADIRAKQSEADKRFEALKEERKSHQTRINQIDVELLQLQGAYKAYEELLKPKEKVS